MANYTTTIAREDKKAQLIATLLGEIKAIDAVQGEEMAATVRADWPMTSLKASSWISHLIEFKRSLKPVAKPSQRTGASARLTEDDVPEGSYAIDGSGANKTVFYVVKWWDGDNGRMFSVYSYVAGRGDEKVNFKVALSVLNRIAEDGAKNAAIRFGKELGVCAMCGSPLTNDASREAGIGPVCAKKF